MTWAPVVIDETRADLTTSVYWVSHWIWAWHALADCLKGLGPSN